MLTNITSEAPSATSALEQLGAVIGEVLDRVDVGWRLQPMGDVVDGPALVDVDGAVRAVLTEETPPSSDERTDDQVVLDALLAAYDYVLAAEVAATRAAKLAESAAQEAYSDHLTGLPNRRAWEQALEREQARCDRNATGAAIAVIDIDRLKQMNDGHGHLAGDLVLRQAAQALSESLRECDLVARIGGDEFAVLVVDFADASPTSITGRIRTALASTDVEASVGVASHTAGQRLIDTFDAADRAMYDQKRSRC